MSKKIPLDVIDEAGNSYYVSERKIYAREISGRFQTLRKIAVWVLLGMFYALLCRVVVRDPVALVGQLLPGTISH